MTLDRLIRALEDFKQGGAFGDLPVACGALDEDAAILVAAVSWAIKPTPHIHLTTRGVLKAEE